MPVAHFTADRRTPPDRSLSIQMSRLRVLPHFCVKDRSVHVGFVRKCPGTRESGTWGHGCRGRKVAPDARLTAPGALILVHYSSIIHYLIYLIFAILIICSVPARQGAHWFKLQTSKACSTLKTRHIAFLHTPPAETRSLAQVRAELGICGGLFGAG